MIDAQYAILKYLPDPSRNEPINIGVVIWIDDRYELVIEDEALGRVLQANPRLDQILLDTFESSLHEAIATSWPRLREAGQNETRWPFPLLVTQAIYTSLEVADKSDASLSQALLEEASWLSSELIKRTQRRSAPRGTQPMRAVTRNLSAFIDAGRVQTEHKIRGSRSGEIREFPFFANSGANVGLDLISLRGTPGEVQIQKSADALAYKLDDVFRSGKVTQAVVYLPADIKPQLSAAAPAFQSRIDDMSVALALSARQATDTFIERADLGDLALFGGSTAAD